RRGRVEGAAADRDHRRSSRSSSAGQRTKSRNVSPDVGTALETTSSGGGVQAAIRSRAAGIGVALGGPLSGPLLRVAFRCADVHDVWTVVTSAKLAPVVLAVAAMAGVYVVQALRWRAIARTPDVSAQCFCEMVVSGVAVNNVLPGRIGDLLRARWLQVAARIPGGRSLATVFVDRAFDVLALVLALGISLPFVASAEWLRRIPIRGIVLPPALLLVLAAARIYT